MISVLMKGHRFKHDLYELIRAIVPNERIEFIEDPENLKDDSYLIQTEVIEKFESIDIITSLFKNDKLINRDCEVIDNPFNLVYDLNYSIKQEVKKGVYNLLSKLSNRTLPWGILTGIRPVKISDDLFQKGLNRSEVFFILQTIYKISKEKAWDIINISQLQKEHIYPLDRDRYSLYVGIPFCPSKCTYCSFPSYDIARNGLMVDQYLKTLLYELKVISKLMKGKKLNTVYIGGGTPTSLKTSELELIIKSIRDSFKEDIKEFTVEAGRPDTLNYDVLSILKDYQVDRISINPQSMNDETLMKIGRKHNSKDVINIYNLAKTIGFDIINMDIILGLAGEDIYALNNTLKEIRKLNPDNLTVHTLAIKRGSKLHKNYNNQPTFENLYIEDMLLETKKFAEEMDMAPYYLYRQKQILGNLENVGYSKKKKESAYNIAMMEEKETIIATGLGGVSKIFFPNENRIERVPNFKDLKEYISRIEELISRKEVNLNKLYMKG